MSTTRSRAKGKTVLTTTDTYEFDAAMHIGELSAKISQLQVSVTASDDRRDTSEAETKLRCPTCHQLLVMRTPEL